jgi:hypothetical protein
VAYIGLKNNFGIVFKGKDEDQFYIRTKFRVECLSLEEVNKMYSCENYIIVTDLSSPKTFVRVVKERRIRCFARVERMG